MGSARAGLLAIGLGVSLQPLDTSVNVAFPAITAAFGLPLQSIQWIAIAYVLTYAAIVLVCGRLGDLYGHRLIYRLGLATSIIALALCALADTYGLLLACRVLQGIGTALIMSCGPALAISLYPDEQRARAVSVYGVLFGLGLALGPLIGGFAVEAMGWQGVYWFRVPIAILALIGSGLLPDAKRGNIGRFDFTGAMLLAFWMSAILLGLALLQSPGAPKIIAACLIVIGAIALALFVVRERRSDNPIIRLSLFSSLSFSSINLLNIAVFLVGFAAILLAPYYLTRVLGLDVRAMGFVMTLWAGGSMLGAWVAGRLGERKLPQRMTAFGFGWILCVGQAIAALCDVTTGLALIVAALLLQGIALGGFQVAYTDTVIATLRVDERGVAGSLAMLTRTLGTVTGAMALAAAFAATESAALATGMPAQMAFLSGFSQVFAWSAAGLALCLLAAMGSSRTAR